MEIGLIEQRPLVRVPLYADSGVSYQRLLNRILRERLSSADTVHARLDRIEKDLARVKKTLAA